jgi:N-methylhydantoinase A
VIVPPSPGVLCALGDATTSKRSESARTVLRRFADLTSDDLRTLLGELAAEAGGRLAEQGVATVEQTTTYQVDVRYHGQGFEIPIDVPDLEGDAIGTLATAFDTEHERLFSFLLTTDHELVNARATVSGPRPSVAAVTLPPSEGPPTPIDTHPIHVSGSTVDAQVYDRATLRAGDVITGPAVVVEMDSTTLVLPDHAATVHPSGSLLINPVREA